MADWCHQYNTEIGSLNQEGKRCMAHHDPWLDHLKSVLHEGILWKQQPKLGKTFSEIDPLSFQQTHEQFGISWIPDTLRIEDPRTVSQNALNLASVYPMRLHLSTLNASVLQHFSFQRFLHLRNLQKPIKTGNLEIWKPISKFPETSLWPLLVTSDGNLRNLLKTTES